MRIAIDARMIYWTGIGRYTLALLNELQQIDHENKYLVLMRREDWKLWEPSAGNFTRVECNINPYSFGEQWNLWLQLRAMKPDLVHFTAPNTPLLYRGRRVVNVHDLTLVDFDTSRGSGFAKMLRGIKRVPFRLVLANDVHSSPAIITVTEYVRKQLAWRFRVSKKKIFTTPLAADPQLASPEPLDRFGDLGTFVFYIGNAYPYKNVAATIEALSLLSMDYPQLNLVVAGKRDTFTVALEEQAKALDVAGRVKFLGYVSDGEMVSLYRAAALYVNPSLSEGFGLQGLEAMAQDLPVVAARATCLPEVYAEAAEYFSPDNPKDQAAAIGRVLKDKALAGRLRAAGRKRIKEFSWRRMARQTLEVYEQVGGKGK
jgi:glycosyltransferase involved in cell wall biosynthesis